MTIYHAFNDDGCEVLRSFTTLKRAIEYLANFVKEYEIDHLTYSEKDYAWFDSDGVACLYVIPSELENYTTKKTKDGLIEAITNKLKPEVEYSMSTTVGNKTFEMIMKSSDDTVKVLAYDETYNWVGLHILDQIELEEIYYSIQ